MLKKLIERQVPVMVFAGTGAVVGYLLLGGPLPGPVGERYGNYLGALFGAVLSVGDVGTLMLRSGIIFLLAFSGSWLLLTLLQRRQRSTAIASSED